MGIIDDVKSRLGLGGSAPPPAQPGPSVANPTVPPTSTEGDAVTVDPAPEVETVSPSVEGQAGGTGLPVSEPQVEPSAEPSVEPTVETESTVATEAKVAQPAIKEVEVSSPLGEKEPSAEPAGTPEVAEGAQLSTTLETDTSAGVGESTAPESATPTAGGETEGAEV